MQTAATGERLAARQTARQNRSELVLQIATCRSPSETARRPCRFQSITAAKTPVFNKPMSLNGSLRRVWPRQSCETRLGAGDLYWRSPDTHNGSTWAAGHEEAPALESPYYGAEVFHEAARGRTIFASRIEPGRRREEEMENNDKEENEQDTRYRKDRHIKVSGHSGMDMEHPARRLYLSQYLFVSTSNLHPSKLLRFPFLPPVHFSSFFPLGSSQ